MIYFPPKLFTHRCQYSLEICTLYQNRLSKASFSLCRFLGKDMTFKCLVTLQFTSSSQFKSFACASMRLHLILRHFFLSSFQMYYLPYSSEGFSFFSVFSTFGAIIIIRLRPSNTDGFSTTPTSLRNSSNFFITSLPLFT